MIYGLNIQMSRKFIALNLIWSHLITNLIEFCAYICIGLKGKLILLLNWTSIWRQFCSVYFNQRFDYDLGINLSPILDWFGTLKSVSMARLDFNIKILGEFRRIMMIFFLLFKLKLLMVEFDSHFLNFMLQDTLTIKATKNISSINSHTPIKSNFFKRKRISVS